MQLPPGLHAPALAQTWQWLRRPLEFFERCRRSFGSSFTYRLVGGRTYVMFSAPEDVKAIFTTPVQCFVSGNEFEPFVGDYSMFVLDGERHRRHRRLVGPPLRGERMRSFAPLIHRLTHETFSRWSPGTPGPGVTALREITLHIIIEAIFGVTERARRETIARSVKDLVEGTPTFLAFLPALRVDAGPLSPWGRFLRRRFAVEALLREEIRRAQAGEGERDSILARLVAEGASQGDPLSEDEIVSELLTLLAAGHETSTAALSWACHYVLADDPVRKSVTDEVRAAVPAGATLEHGQLKQMPLLDSCIDETLRKSNIILMMPRFTAAPVEIGKVTVPAGVYVTPGPHLTHHDPAIFPEPQRFVADRFLREKHGAFEFYPFGGGHRHCIGAGFASYTMRAVLASMLAMMDVRRADGRPQKGVLHRITMTPDRGSPLVIERWRS